MSFEPVIAFVRQSEDFALGFEAGRIWEQLKAGLPGFDGQMFHVENAEMVMRMIEETGVPARAEFTADAGWMVLRVGGGV